MSNDNSDDIWDATAIAENVRERRTKPKPRCRKCESVISESASACSECGYDATPGTFAQLGILLAAPVTLLGVALAGLALVAMVAGAMSISETLGTLLALAFLFCLPTAYTAWYIHKLGATAAK